MLEAFRDWKPQAKTEALLSSVRGVLAAHPNMTMRHLYHYLIDDGVLKPTAASMKVLINLTTNARMAGMLDWDYLADTFPRVLRTTTHDVEVWIERDSLVGLVLDAVDPYDVGVVSFRAYPSVSTLYAATKRIPGGTIYVPTTDSARDRDVLRDLTDRINEMQDETHPIVVVGIELDDVQELEEFPPEAFIDAIRSRVAAFGPRETTPLDRIDAVRKANAGYRAMIEDLEAAMDSTGDTTRAASLKAKIRTVLTYVQA